MERATYKNGDVVLHIDSWDVPEFEDKYWIQCSVTSMAMNQTQIEQLHELLTALMEEINGGE